MTITNYTIKHSIGQGGMATVYLANHQLLLNQVAIKVLSQEYVRNENIRKRFLAEARNMARMSHKNIIKVTDLIDEGDIVAFVMEHIEGETLKEYLDRKGKLRDEEIKTIFSQMLEAVGYVHEQNLVHRDIKPSNFMITPKGQIKLLDFGIAKNTDANSADYTQTGTSQNMGTPMYMSPEQIKSTKDVTLQSDIYSLGVVLWQMVMGKKPYDTNTSSTYELQNKIVTENLSLTNSSFDSIIAVATAKELNIRFNNCDELKSKLENLDEEGLDKTKSYSSEVSEKTIVDNSKGKTVVQENKNHSSKPQIDIPYTAPNKSKNSNIRYIILGIVVIILGIFFSYKKDISTADELIVKPTGNGPVYMVEDSNIYSYADIEVKPDFPGGIEKFYKYIGDNYRAPEVEGLKGKIDVTFIVDKDGKLADIKVIRDIGYGTGQEALRVLKKCPRWNPGEQNGKKVRVLYSLPITIQ